MKLFAVLPILTFMMSADATAQSLGQSPGARVARCPHYLSEATLEVDGIYSLEALVGASDLIIIGKVVDVLPAVLLGLDEPLMMTNTDSIVSITEVLRGSLPATTSTITLNQMGGKVGTCDVVNSDDPVVKVGEEYILFLRSHRRDVPPNTSGSPRYEAIGLWSGKAKIVDHKVQFLPAARPPLHSYDNMDLNAFRDLVKNRSVIIPLRKPPHF